MPSLDFRSSDSSIDSRLNMAEEITELCQKLKTEINDSLPQGKNYMLLIKN